MTMFGDGGGGYDDDGICSYDWKRVALISHKNDSQINFVSTMSTLMNTMMVMATLHQLGLLWW